MHKFSKTFDSQVKILGARRVIGSKFPTEDPLILGATAHNLVARATWCPGFVHICHCANYMIIKITFRIKLTGLLPLMIVR
jgi:hypothetical protein